MLHHPLIGPWLRMGSRALERALNYNFRDVGLAREACTHCSWPDNACPSYQRLEFLGDALIDLGITRYFVTTFRCLRPGPPTMHHLVPWSQL